MTIPDLQITKGSDTIPFVETYLGYHITRGESTHCEQAWPDCRRWFAAFRGGAYPPQPGQRPDASSPELSSLRAYIEKTVLAERLAELL